MKKEDLKPNKIGAYPCKACLRKHIISYPILKTVADLTYAQCSNLECNKYDPYEFIGSTKKGAINNWNDTMVHDYDSYDKRQKSE